MRYEKIKEKFPLEWRLQPVSWSGGFSRYLGVEASAGQP